MKARYKYVTPYDVYNVWIETANYANGRTAVMLMDDEGQVACATVNVPEFELAPNEVIVKTWSENEKMLDFLIMNGICADTGREVPCGYCKGRVCTLLIKD